MLELVAIFVFLASLCGMVWMFVLKLPVLASLPRTTPVLQEEGGNTTPSFFARIKARVTAFPLVKDFSFELLLQKILSRFRILALKIESKTGKWLEALRKKSQENNKPKENDNYWEELGKKDK
jgi:uncharacterized protein YqhQ